MSALVIAEVIIRDPGAFEAYRTSVPAIVAAFGGEYIARGAMPEILEGNAPQRRVTIFRFPDLARAKAWYDSAEYRPMRELRERTTDSILKIVEGL